MAADLFLSCLGLSFLLQARPQLVLGLYGGDAARAGSKLALWTACASFLEFLLGPTAGGAADAFGRKPLLLASSAFNMLLRVGVAACPHVWFVALEKVLTSPLLTAGSVATSAAVADLASGRQLAVYSAKIGISAAAAFIVGPATAGILIKRRGPRMAYALSATAAAAQLALLCTRFRETLPREQRRPAPGFVSPLSFARLVASKSRRLRTLMCVGFLQTFCEPKTWNDMVQLYMRVDVGLPVDRIGHFFASFGMAGMLAKGFTARIVMRRGAVFHTSLSNLAMVIGFLAWGASPSSRTTSIVLPLALAPLYLDHRAGVTSRANDLAVEAGFGKGEFAALFGNLRALGIIVGPLMFGRLYAWGTTLQRRRPGLGFWAAALLALAAEVVHSTLPSGASEDLTHERDEKRGGRSAME